MGYIGRFRSRSAAGFEVLAVLAISAVVLLPLLLGAAPASLSAQDLPGAFRRPGPDPDFLFQRPRMSIGVRGGVFLHGAGSDLFDFTEERFTIDRCDFLTVDLCAFRGLSFGIEGGLWLGSRTEVTLGLDGSRVTLSSEYRDFLEVVESDGTEEELPIRQTTQLREGPALSLGVRWYVFDRGERLGQFVWLPRSWNAFVSGGAGVTGYELTLGGDFVKEFVDGVGCEMTEEGCRISTERFTSGGHTFFPFLGAGFELTISDHTAFTVEGRYLWGSDELGRDFERDFIEPLDLSGARLTAGFSYRN